MQKKTKNFDRKSLKRHLQDLKNDINCKKKEKKKKEKTTFVRKKKVKKRGESIGKRETRARQIAILIYKVKNAC